MDDIKIKSSLDNVQANNIPVTNASISALIIKPSSLNYKISLRMAVEEFIKKEHKIESFDVDVEEEL